MVFSLALLQPLALAAARDDALSSVHDKEIETRCIVDALPRLG